MLYSVTDIHNSLCPLFSNPAVKETALIMEKAILGAFLIEIKWDDRLFSFILPNSREITHEKVKDVFRTYAFAQYQPIVSDHRDQDQNIIVRITPKYTTVLPTHYSSYLEQLGKIKNYLGYLQKEIEQKEDQHRKAVKVRKEHEAKTASFHENNSVNRADRIAQMRKQEPQNYTPCKTDDMVIIGQQHSEDAEVSNLTLNVETIKLDPKKEDLMM